MMLFDSDVNVYEDQNVELQQAAEFNIRGKKQKYFTQKELDEMAAKRQEIINKQKLLREDRARLLIAEKMPATIINAQFRNQQRNEEAYIPVATVDVDLGLADDLIDAEQAEGYEKLQRQKAKNKQIKRQKIDQTFDTPVEVEPAADEKLNEDIAPTVKARQQQEEDQKRREEEEALIA